MTVSTQAILNSLVYLGMALDDDKVALAGGAQSSSPRISAEAARFTKVATAADSAQLPNIGTGEAGLTPRIVINDTANAMAMFPSAGEKQNGVANAALSIPAGQAAVFFPVAASATGGADWRSAVIP